MTHTLRIRGGAVSCPLRGALDVETCFRCADLIEVRAADGDDVVVCQGVRPYVLEDLYLLSVM